MAQRHKIGSIRWQLYWPSWWKIMPWFQVYPRDEDGPAELWGGIGAFQFSVTLWEVN